MEPEKGSVKSSCPIESDPVVVAITTITITIIIVIIFVLVLINRIILTTMTVISIITTNQVFSGRG